LLFIQVQVIAWWAISEMTCNVSSGMLNFTNSLIFCGTVCTE